MQTFFNYKSYSFLRDKLFLFLILFLALSLLLKGYFYILESIGLPGRPSSLGMDLEKGAFVYNPDFDFAVKGDHFIPFEEAQQLLKAEARVLCHTSVYTEGTTASPGFPLAQQLNDDIFNIWNALPWTPEVARMVPIPEGANMCVEGEISTIKEHLVGAEWNSSWNLLSAKEMAAHLFGNGAHQNRLALLSAHTGHGPLKMASQPIGYVRLAAEHKIFIDTLQQLIESPSFSRSFDGILTLDRGEEFNEGLQKTLYYVDLNKPLEDIDKYLREGGSFGAVSLIFLDMPPGAGTPGSNVNVEGQETYFSIIERPHHSGIYGAWASAEQPGYWKLYEYYLWLQREDLHLSKIYGEDWASVSSFAEAPADSVIPVTWYLIMGRDFVYYIEDLLMDGLFPFFFEPLPRRTVTLVTEVPEYFSYPFRDVVEVHPLVRYDYNSALNYWQMLVDCKPEPPCHGTTAICVGRLSFYKEAAEGLKEYFGTALHYANYDSLGEDFFTVPLECTPGPEDYWTTQPYSNINQGQWSFYFWAKPLWRDVYASTLILGLSHLHTLLIDQFIFGQGFHLMMVFYYNVLDSCLEWMFFGLVQNLVIFYNALETFLEWAAFGLVQSLVIFYNALETFLEWAAFGLVQSLVIFYNILQIVIVCITFPWRCCVALGHFLSSSILWSHYMVMACFGNFVLFLERTLLLGQGLLESSHWLWWWSTPWPCIWATMDHLLGVPFRALAYGYMMPLSAVPFYLSALLHGCGEAVKTFWILLGSAFSSAALVSWETMLSLYKLTLSGVAFSWNCCRYLLDFFLASWVHAFLGLSFLASYGMGFYCIRCWWLQQFFSPELRALSSFAWKEQWVMVLREHFYDKKFRGFVEPFFDQSLWWFLQGRRWEDISKEIYRSRKDERLRNYMRMAFITYRESASYSFRLLCTWIWRKVLRWLGESSWGYLFSPLIYVIQLRLLGLRLHWDLVDYEFCWKSLNYLRTAYYTFFNVDFFWSIMGTLGSEVVENPPRNALPEKSAVAIPPVGPWFVYVTSFFRPVDQDNFAASALESQRAAEHAWNLLLSLCVAFSYNILWIVALIAAKIFWLCSKGQLFFLQLRVHCLRSLLFLEKQSFYAHLRSSLCAVLGLFGVPLRQAKHWGLWASTRELLAALCFFVVGFLRVLRVLGTFFFLLLWRGRLVLFLALVLFFVGTYSFVFYLGQAFFFVTLYIVETLEGIFLWDFPGAYIDALMESPKDPAYYYKKYLYWEAHLKGFAEDWKTFNLVDRFWVMAEGFDYTWLTFTRFVASQLPPWVYFYKRFGFHYAILWVEFMVLVRPRLWMVPTWDILMELGIFRSFLTVGTAIFGFLETLVHNIPMAFKAFGQGLSKGLQWCYSWAPLWLKRLAQSEGVLYSRWLCYYGLLDFWNFRFLCFEAPRALWTLLEQPHGFVEILTRVALEPLLWVEQSALASLWEECAFFFWGDLATGYGWKYSQWARWQLILDRLSVDFKWKPFNLYMELFPSTEEYHLFEETLYVIELRSFPHRSSVAGFLHNPYVLWSIRQSSLWLMDSAQWLDGDQHKIALALLVRPVFYFFLVFTMLLIFLKGFRNFLWMRPEGLTSGPYEWAAFRNYPTQASFEALVQAPSFVAKKYLKEQRGGYRGNFYNLALLLLGDRYGTKDPVEALGSLGNEGPLGERLALESFYRRLWGSREREELWRFLYRRPAKAKLKVRGLKNVPKTAEVVAFLNWWKEASTKEADPQRMLFPEHLDVRVLHQAQQLFGRKVWSFMVDPQQKADFLHWFMDDATADWHQNFITDHMLMMYLMAYLYRRDPHIARALAMTEPLPMDQTPEESGSYIVRNQGAWANVYHYFAALDKELYRGRLPYWLCHKDSMDLFSYLAPKYGATDGTDDEAARLYFKSPSEEPVLCVSFFFWYGLLIICAVIFLGCIIFGEGNAGPLVEMRQAFDSLFSSFHWMSLIDINLLGGVNHSSDADYGPSGPDFDEFDFSFEVFKDVRVKYSSALADEHGRNFGLQEYRSYWIRVPVWVRGFFSDFWPHWGLCSALPIHRGLTALILLGLVVSVLKVILRDSLVLAAGRPSRTPGERVVALLRERLLARWRERSPATLRVYSELPRAPYFKDFYALKFYYALKVHGRRGVLSYAKRGPVLRAKVSSWRNFQELWQTFRKSR